MNANPMRAVRLEKAVINIGAGEAGERLVKAVKVLGMVTKKKPIRTVARTTNRDLGVRQGMQIGCKVTLRGKVAEEFVKTALWIRENRLAEYSFDPEGNFSFGIQDYTDFPWNEVRPGDRHLRHGCLRSPKEGRLQHSPSTYRAKKAPQPAEAEEG